MQNQLSAPTASGSFVKTPFAHLLVYALERRLSGTFEFTSGATSIATMLVVGGCPAKLRTHEPVHFLGGVMLELGMITPEQLQASLARMQKSPRLQGQIFLELGITDQAHLDAGLRAQVERKVEHLFSYSTETVFAYYDNVDFLQRFGGPPTPIDAFPVLWRGVREAPAWEHVDATLRRVGNVFIKPSASAQLERFAFTPHELEAIEMLRDRPARLVDITSVLGPSVGQVLVYLLMIMKQIDLVDPAQVQLAAPRPPPSNPGIPPSSGQAFARLQLQRQAGPRPVVVEEVSLASGADDERASSPGMRAPVGAFGTSGARSSAFGPPPESPITPAPVPMPGQTPAVHPPAADGGLTDIGSMISLTIQQSAAPPAMPSAPAAPVIPQAAQVPAAPPSAPPAEGEPAGRALTAEQNALKTKILERADQITSQNYFQMLGIDRDATSDTVQKAFFGLAKVWHPDRLPPALVDVKDACSKVFTHLTEAHATLMDPKKRQDYMTLLRDGGATPDDQAKIQAIVEAATEFQKSEFLLKRNLGDPQAYAIVKRCVELDGEQADYLATLAWLDAQKPQWQGSEKTREKIMLLDRCIQKNPNCERAYFYRGMLFKRIDDAAKALKDFKRAAELNPRNLDAMREVRLHAIRKQPASAAGARTSKPPEPEILGGLFGKLFKK